MINFKREIAKLISEYSKIDEEDIYNNIQIIKESSKGDYAFPCFSLAKILKKSPSEISDELKDNIKSSDYIEKIDSINGYLNVYINKEILVKEVFEEFEKKKDQYGKSNIGEGKNILVEYSSPNIAKPFHIGHLRSTVIGNALYNIYKALGYNVTSINHLGDYGTQFGKMIEGYKRWGQDYNIEENPIDELTKIYVRINDLCKVDESVLEECRNNFKKLEENDPYCVQIWEKFRDLSLKEFQRIYDILDIRFDSIKGESFYKNDVEDLVKKLESKNALKKSEGALIVDLEHKSMPPLMLKKSNESTTYATRDLAAILYRAKTYDFDKCIYVVGSEQSLHLNQVFETAKLLDIDEKYTNGLVHAPFGMVRLKTGKMSTREGNVIKLEDILNESITRAKDIIKEKNADLEDSDVVSKQVGIGSVIFNDLYNSRIKDEIFDWDIMLNFQGETCPYIQYMYVRINSILEKSNQNILINDINYSKLIDELSYNLIKLLYNFTDVIQSAANKNEPYILSRYLIDIAKAYSAFYSKNKVLSDNIEERNARLYLINIVGNILKSGAGLLGIKMPKRM